MLNKSRGRPRGNPPTKARIIEVACELFARDGYRRTTVRAIATAAGVDQALISYHFGSKQGLFGASIQLPCSEPLALRRALDGDPAGLADRLLRAVTDTWDAAETTAPAAVAIHDEDVMRVFREYLECELIGGIAEFLGGPDATERATAVVTLLAGLIFTRYLSPLHPTANMSPADVRRMLRPALQAALQGRSPRRS